MPYPIELWLVHPREEACDAFRHRFAGLPSVRVLQTRFESLDPHDCFVTAGNAMLQAVALLFPTTQLAENARSYR